MRQITSLAGSFTRQISTTLLVSFVAIMPLTVGAAQPVFPTPTAAVYVPANVAANTFAPVDRADLLRRLNQLADPASELESQLFADAADGRLDQVSLLHAALIASGAGTRDQLQLYAAQAAHLADELRATTVADRPVREQVEAIFNFMHRRALYGGYDLAATDLRQTLDSGRFNCVSATVLFNYLASELGLNVCGLEMPSHAMSRILTNAGPIDVETTCPRWFELMHDPQQQAELASQTAGAAAMADRSKAREVTPTQLIAMIYYNRAVDFLAERRFAEAAAANAKAIRLDRTNKTARGNLLATLNNWAIDLGNAGQYATAIDLLRQGMAVDSRFEPFTQNYLHVHRQWLESLGRNGGHMDAQRVLARAMSDMPHCDYFRQMQREIGHQERGETR